MGLWYFHQEKCEGVYNIKIEIKVICRVFLYQTQTKQKLIKFFDALLTKYHKYITA